MSEDTASATDSKEDPIVPAAIVETSSRRSLFIWIVPLLAITVTAWVSLDAWFARGPQIEIEFLEAHGLEAGDSVRCRGVEVGRVEEVFLDWANGRGRVKIKASFEKNANSLLRMGTRFWIQHPEFDFGGIRGLDTVVGPRYLAVLPGTGAIDDGPFIGLNRMPVVADVLSGDLEIIVESSERAGMRRGGVVSYRGMPAGRILDVELASDSTRVRSTVLIEERYAPLVRSGTRFFSISGVAFEFGLDGFRTDVDSLESIIAGGIGFATPPDAGAAAVTGARFELASKLDQDWLEWSPAIASGDLSSESPPKVRAILRWKSGLLRRARSRRGWITLLPDGTHVVPTMLVTPPEEALGPTLEFNGISLPVGSITTSAAPWSSALRVISGEKVPASWTWGSGERTVQVLESPLDPASTMLVHAGADLGPIPVPAGLWRRVKSGIVIDRGLGFADDMVGSPVTDAGTGFLVGLLVNEAGEVQVACVGQVRDNDS